MVRAEDDEDSDIDLVAELPADVSILELLALQRRLTEIVEHPVDLVPARLLRPAVAAEIARESVLL